MRSFLRSASWPILCFFALALLFPRTGFAQVASGNPIRIGLIGLDTSHVIEFTKRYNDPADPEYVPGAKVVAAYKGGSPDIGSSWRRVEGYTTELRDKWKVEIVDDIPTLCAKVDAVLITSLDGRKHLEQLKPVLAAKKPVFIDKPLAANYQGAKEIVQLAQASGVPWFSASTLRFWEETQRLKASPESGGILGCSVYGPCHYLPYHVDMAFYGIHSIEVLYAILGAGCESVSRVHTPDTDVVVGTWKDGRVGEIRGFEKGPYDFGITVFGQKKILRSEPVSTLTSYRSFLVELLKFIQTGISPVNADETLEMFAFMEAADISKARAGALVPLSEVTK